MVALRNAPVVPLRRMGCKLLLYLREPWLRGPKLHLRHNPGSAASSAVPRPAWRVSGRRRGRPRRKGPCMSVMPGAYSRAFSKSHRKPHRIQIVVGVIMRKIRQHLAAVRRLPPEQLERKLVGVVPRHLLGDEIIHTRLLVDLRQLPVVSKRIRVPADAHIHAVMLLNTTASQPAASAPSIRRRAYSGRVPPTCRPQFPSALP